MKISSGSLGVGQVTTAEILDATVATGDIAYGAVTTLKLAADSLTT